MLNSLDRSGFFSDAEIARLRELSLWQETNYNAQQLAFAGLMLAPIMQIVMRDNATTSAEFESVRKYLDRIERNLGLGTHTELEAIGTDMGLLPMLPSSWSNEQFDAGRKLLSEVIVRLSDADATAVRDEISRAALDAARAGSPHTISLHIVDQEERAMIQTLIRELSLDKSQEGLTLREKSA